MKYGVWEESSKILPQFKTGTANANSLGVLPAGFNRQAVEIGKQFQLSPRTVDDISPRRHRQGLEKLKAGNYKEL